MDTLQVSIAWLLLKVTFELNAAGALLCPTCTEGYFVKTNCSVNRDTYMGVQCERCTDCSVSHQDTLVKCSTFADSVCKNQTTTTVAPTVASTPGPVSAFKPWTILPVVTVSVILIMLLSLFLILLSCRFRQRTKHPGNKLVPSDDRLLPPGDTP